MTCICGIAITCCAICIATSAHAEFITGNELLAHLRTKDAHYNIAQGYIAGVHDAGRGFVHCSPATITIGQLADMTRQRLEHMPHSRDMSADILIMHMLKATWPCPKKGAAPDT